MIGLVTLLVLVVFLLSNRDSVGLGFWPFGFVLAVPLGAVVLVALVVGFLGGLAAHLPKRLGAQRRARRAETGAAGSAELMLAERKLIAAIDTAEVSRAAALIRDVAPHCGLVKLGLEYFSANGPAGVSVAEGVPLFLDLKLHDIPNTVAGAVRSLRPLGAAMLTVHAAGGAAMIEAAREAAEGGAKNRPLILAVTVLTSLDASALSDTGIAGGVTQQVLRLARLALAAGADGLVCAAHELPALRDAFGSAPVLVVPGIRPAGGTAADQARVMTPEVAISSGASYIVVGRPITGAKDPARAAADIARAIA